MAASEFTCWAILPAPLINFEERFVSWGFVAAAAVMVGLAKLSWVIAAEHPRCWSPEVFHRYSPATLRQRLSGE